MYFVCILFVYIFVLKCVFIIVFMTYLFIVYFFLYLFGVCMYGYLLILVDINDMYGHFWIFMDNSGYL